MKEPLISIVMPIFNTETYLAEAIDSVIDQTYQNWELFLVNDSSPGNTKIIVDPFIAADNRIKYFEHPNAGPSFTRNQGILKSKGDFIAFLDSDDVWHPGKLEMQLTVFEDKPLVGVVYSQRKTIDDEGQMICGYLPKLHAGMLLNKLWVDNFVCLSSSIIRRSVVQKVGLFDDKIRMSQDYDFWLRVARVYPFAYINKGLVSYRIHSDQISKRTEERSISVRKIRRNFYSQYGSEINLIARLRLKSLMHLRSAERSEKNYSLFLAFVSYIRAILVFPFEIVPWIGMSKLVLPTFVVQLIKRYK